MSTSKRLSDWLLNDAGFLGQYNSLLAKSASHQVGANFRSENAVDVSTIDWPYLLYCASLLSSPQNDTAVHDCALRIAQYALVAPDVTNLQKDSAAIILEGLANYPSIKLAEDKSFLNRDIEQRLPTKNLLNWTKKRLEQEIFINDNETIFANNFQKKFWDKIDDIDLASLSAPTSAGKSYIIKQWVAGKVRSSKPPFHVAFIVPTRALIAEVEKNFKEILAGMGNKVNVTSSPLPSALSSNKVNILVFTQERLQIFFNQRKSEQALDILVVDEAHKVGDKARGVLLQQVIEAVLEASPKVKVLYSSPLTENPESLLEDYKTIRKTDVIKTSENTVNQNLFWCTPVHGLNKQLDILLCSKKGKLKVGSLSLDNSPGSSLTKRLPLIAYTIGREAKGNIVYVNGAADAERVAMQIYEFLGEELDKTGDKQIRDIIKLVKEQVHKEYSLATTLERGVAFHYGNMPDIVRAEIERLFSSGVITFLICTSTLIEGVNTSCRNIFLRNPKKGIKNPMSKDDFWNLAGRAGRWGKEFQGNIFCIDPEDWGKEHAPEYRAEFKIQRSTDNAILSLDNLIAFIKGEYKGEEYRVLEYVFSYLYCQFKIRGSLVNAPWSKRFPANSLAQLEKAILNTDSRIRVPFDIIKRNPGISPAHINDLLISLEASISSKTKTYGDLLPAAPVDSNAVKSYASLFFYLADIFSVSELGNTSKHAWSNAIVVVGWMRGHPLSMIISARIKNASKRKPDLTKKERAGLIREVMEKVEKIARFYAPKYLACYVDVLRYFLEQNKQTEYALNLADYDLLLEYGVTTETQISLVSLGLSRATSLALSDFKKEANLTEENCLEWIKRGDYKKYSLSSIMEREIDELVKFIG